MVRRLVSGMVNGGIAILGALAGSFLGMAVHRGWVHFPFLSQALSMLPFSLGWKARRAVYARMLPAIGQNAVLHHGVTLEDPRSRFGDDVWVSVGAYLDYVEIGDHVLVGPGAVLLSGGRQHSFDRTDIPIKLQGNPRKQPLRIERGAWIGANATVMCDVGHDAIVGAGAVVTRPVPPFAIVAGNPARILRFRNQLAGVSSEPLIRPEIDSLRAAHG